MPIYEYVCDDCNERYERIVLSQSQAISCPKCSSTKHTIQLSIFASPSNGKSSASPSSSPRSGGIGGCCGGGGCGCH